MNNISDNFVSIGVETSGLDVESDEILRLTAIKWTNGFVSEKFDTCVKPEKKVVKQVKKLIGIKKNFLKKALDLSTALLEFSSFIGDLPLVAHNIEFDVQFLSRAYNNILEKQFSNRTLCTLKLSFEFAELNTQYKLENYKIMSVIKAYLQNDVVDGLDNDVVNDLNNALSDCYKIGLVYKKIIALMSI